MGDWGFLRHGDDFYRAGLGAPAGVFGNLPEFMKLSDSRQQLRTAFIVQQIHDSLHEILLQAAFTLPHLGEQKTKLRHTQGLQHHLQDR